MLIIILLLMHRPVLRMDERVECMSQSSNDRLQFSINESVWLKDDAPAEEILSMALEPDITVEENWNDVTIKGFLRLTGEYKPAHAEQTEAENHPAPFRTIDEIMETTNGTAVLEHHFPIDITIPADRVPNLEELFVIIDSFDYELSEHRHIQLQADLAISGLRQSNSHQPEPRTEMPTAPSPTPMIQPAPAPVPAPMPAPSQEVKAEMKKPLTKPDAAVKPVKKAENKEAEKKLPETKSVSKSKQPVTQSQAQAVKAVKETAKETKAEKAEKKEEKKALQETGQKAVKSSASKKARDFSDIPFADALDEMPTDRPGYESEDSDDTDAIFEYEAFRKPHIDEPAFIQPSVAFGGRAETPAEAPSAPAQPAATQNQAEQPSSQSEQPEQPADGNSLYLTKVLAGTDSEQQTLVKIYIVQTGDSLESISTHYKVPVTTLMKKNQLPTGDIEAGALLVIPVAKAASDA